MDQSFPLMKPLIPLLFKRKFLTNRVLTPPKYFRRRCDIGDEMRFYDNYRQKGMIRIGVGIVIETNEWSIEDIPIDLNDAR